MIKFDTATAALAEHGFAVVDNVLSESEMAEVLRIYKGLYDQGQFRPAGIGTSRVSDSSIRGDQIVWMDPKRSSPVLANWLEELRLTLNNELRLSLRNFEGHFAIYPPGAFYKRHLDNAIGKSRRLISMVLYLNANWTEADGGDLVLHLPGGPQSILPVNNRLALFLSEKVEHEVRPTISRARLSFTGWFTREQVL